MCLKALSSPKPPLVSCVGALTSSSPHHQAGRLGRGQCLCALSSPKSPLVSCVGALTSSSPHHQAGRLGRGQCLCALSSPKSPLVSCVGALTSLKARATPQQGEFSSPQCSAYIMKRFVHASQPMCMAHKHCFWLVVLPVVPTNSALTVTACHMQHSGNSPISILSLKVYAHEVLH
jgi:hypothetical protein